MGKEYNLKHLTIDKQVSQEFISPKTGQQSINIPVRERQAHAQKLKQELEVLKNGLDNQKEYSLITLIGKEDYDLLPDSIENKNADINILRKGESASGESIAVLRISNKKGISNIEKKINDYELKNTKSGKPRYQALVESIESLQKTLLSELWNGKNDQWPTTDQEQVWWEVWIMGGNNNIKERNINRGLFVVKCSELEIKCELDDFISFANTQVTAIKANILQLQELIDKYDYIVEFDPPTKPIVQYMAQNSMTRVEDFNVDNIKVEDTNTRIAIIDTGIARENPLLKPIIDSEKLFTLEEDKKLTIDYSGHGTNVAGVAGYGDLSRLIHNEEYIINYKIESVRIPLDDDGENKELWGGITKKAVEVVEDADLDKNRIFNMSIGASNSNYGYPTSWSASVDEICYNKGNGRLMTIAAGNLDKVDEEGYIDRNLSTLIDDPAQALNAICVGGCTVLDQPITKLQRGRVLAKKGELSPFTTTGHPKLAIKPDLLYEAGNVVLNDDDIDDCCSGLAILTTGRNILGRPLELSHQTSMAAPGVARCLAIIWAQNPTHSPATIRGLLVHSCTIVPSLRNQFSDKKKAELLRSCGYGIPNLEFACRSAKSSVCLISEGEYKYFDDKGKVRREMLIYDLPWPKDFLIGLGEEKIKLKITLSYFIEPNPKQATSAYSGGSLFWDLQGPYETETTFLKRVNKANRANGDNERYSNSIEWEIGIRARGRGTIQSDYVYMTATELAACGKVVICPRKGWWDNLRENKDKTIPYSLLISAEAVNEEIDLYTEVENVLAVENNITAEDISVTQIDLEV